MKEAIEQVRRLLCLARGIPQNALLEHDEKGSDDLNFASKFASSN